MYKFAWFLRFVALIFVGIAIYQHSVIWFIFAWLVFNESSNILTDWKFEKVSKFINSAEKAIRNIHR